ncbi:MAG: HesB/YadR/YfhF [Solirubrobacterales bacterium]|nr:HesB/YadR/YfhF [Solirubrobacterales bacterium]
MLTVTRTAAEVLDSIVASTPEPDSVGVRISRIAGSDGEPALKLAAVESPDPEDEIMDRGAEHASLFIEPAASAMLDGKVLDARVEGQQVAFMLADAEG